MTVQAEDNINVVVNTSAEALLPAAVQASKAQLQQSWKFDPKTARLPFPQVQLMPPGVDVRLACTPRASVENPAPTVIYCADSRAVLLEHDLLAIAYRLQKRPAVAYWIAVGLAERLQARASALSPAATSLQTSCLAGVLLGARGPGLAAVEADRSMKAAANAYGDAFSGVVGTGPQRAYALLSGLGATSLDCSTAHMTRLASGQVPIPPDLGTRGPSVGIDVLCRQPPACPRRMTSALGGV
ncbi:MAG: hypothetical protein ACKO45_08220 [Cyanobium sp.]